MGKVLISLFLLTLTGQVSNKKNRGRDDALAGWMSDSRNAFENLASSYQQLQADIQSLTKKLSHDMHALGRQMMLQQFYAEERVRSEGDSGLKQVRARKTGMRNYFFASHTDRSVAAVHDHSNNIRTVGLGEFIAVLNGIEFRTRHNDYRLYQPSTTSTNFHKTEAIPFPSVPESVKRQPSVDAQIKEMREYFKAWRDENSTLRNYKDFFKPILCYLEGAWTLGSKSGRIEEPFFSDRHRLEARTWFELQDSIRFTSYTGKKFRRENLAFLPTKLIYFKEDQSPVFAQWNYRILCHPLKEYLSPRKLELVDDLHVRLSSRYDMHRYAASRKARFTAKVPIGNESREVRVSHTLIDTLMSQIPGKNNYPGYIEGQDLDGKGGVLDADGRKMNSARYHRVTSITKKDAMGLMTHSNGFSDSNLYVALNTQDRIPGLSMENKKHCTGRRKGKKCKKITLKTSYAIPLEIIYLTPLTNWNPYNIPYKGAARSKEGKTVNKDNKGKRKRNGACSNINKAYNGSNSRIYYRIPKDFFTSRVHEYSEADTTKKWGVCVLNKTGHSVRVMASGIRTFLPNIPGVGILRQRYPIMPIHTEGSTVYKELDALKDILMDKSKHDKMLYNTHIDTDGFIEWTMAPSPVAMHRHTHTVVLSALQLSNLKSGSVPSLRVQTSVDNRHYHEVEVAWHTKKKTLYYTSCDSRRKCRDKHPRDFMKVESKVYQGAME